MSYISFFKKPFHLLDQPRYRWILIAVVLVFSVVFLNVFVPFNSNQWHNDSGVWEFLQLSAFGVIAGAILFISQFVIRRFISVKEITIGTFVLWTFGEVLLMILAFSVYESIIDGSFAFFLGLIKLTFRYTLLTVAIPYSLALLYISYQIHQKEVVELKSKAKQPADKLLDIKDEKGVIRFSVSVEQVLYFESADNYVFIYYARDAKVEKEMVRNSMKNIESLVEGLPIVRCHRSFMINLKRIEFVNYEKTKCQIKLKELDSFIPVSRKYFPQFKPYLTK